MLKKDSRHHVICKMVGILCLHSSVVLIQVPTTPQMQQSRYRYTIFHRSQQCISMVQLFKIPHSIVLKLYYVYGGCWGFTTVPVTKTIRLSEWVTPGDTAIPGMTSLKDGDLQHSSALAQSPKGDIEPNHPSEINPNSDSRSRSDGRSRRFVQYRVDQSQDRDQDHFSPDHRVQSGILRVSFHR